MRKAAEQMYFGFAEINGELCSPLVRVENRSRFVEGFLRTAENLLRYIARQ